MDSRFQIPGDGFRIPGDGFWIVCWGLRIPGDGFRIPCQWNLDSGFLELFPDSKAQDSGFHKQNVSGIWITLQLHGTKRLSYKGRGIE